MRQGRANREHRLVTTKGGAAAHAPGGTAAAAGRERAEAMREYRQRDDEARQAADCRDARAPGSQTDEHEQHRVQHEGQQPPHPEGLDARRR